MVNLPWPRGAMPLRVSDFHFPLSDFHFPLSDFHFPLSIFQPRKRTAFTGWVYSRPIMCGVRGIYRPVTGRPCVACVLLRHNFSSTDSISKKKLYFISAFSIDLYTAHRYIHVGQLNNYSINYKSKLEALKLLPLTYMYLFEINDNFFIKSLKSSGDHFNIKDFISFSSNATRSGSFSRMCHFRSTTRVSSQLYFKRLHNYTLKDSLAVECSASN